MEYFKAINDHSRATYYVLPLIYLNKFSFGPPDNFIDAYTSGDATFVVAKVKSAETVGTTVWLNEFYLGEEDNHLYFRIPPIHRLAVMKFMEGKYSEMGEIAHNNIRGYSSLDFKKKTVDMQTGKAEIHTDARLLALVKHEDLRTRLEWLLSYPPIKSVVVIDEDSELMSPPRPEEIWKGEVPNFNATVE